ncbi:MAG: phosphate ABC transporter substrate-binding protein, partial [Planctomycetaceae bacterium]|nr:phosphate ABC transporter substrate-binding protein [Planctomycetaceae bacterium]
MKHISLLAAAVFLLATPCFSQDRPQPSSGQHVLNRHIVGLWVMGQSLGDGSESLPLVTPADPGWGNYKFKRGIRTWAYNNLANKPKERLAEQFTFVPLTATRNGGLGETIANGLADHLKSSCLGNHRNNAKQRTIAPHFLVANAGE